MAVRTDSSNRPLHLSTSATIADEYLQGIEAGILGAFTIAVWFFLVDWLSGRPLFYTPNALGTALFRHGEGLERPELLPISFEMVLGYTWVHGLVFCAIGGIAAKLLTLAERQVHAGFGIILFFVIFEFGFVGAALLFAEPIMRVLAWPAVLVGNLLAAAAMTAFFWRLHASLKIDP
jgi:hypothetical protein